MTSIRKLSFFVMAIAMAAFALPAQAASSTKTFYAVFPALISAGDPITITVRFNNNSPPPGISTINSILISPASGVTIYNITPGSATPAGAGYPAGSYIVNNIPGIKRGTYLDFQITAKAATCVNGTWGAEANTGNAYPGGDSFGHDPQEKLVSACDGTIGCDTSNDWFSSDGVLDPNADIAFGGNAGWGVRRGPNLNTSQTCVPVAFNFELNNQVASFVWDKASGQTATFKYVVVFDPTRVDAADPTTGWTQKRPSVSWGIPNPVPSSTDYVPALACSGDNLLLGQALLPTIPGDTAFSTNPNPQYKPNNLAMMCVAQQGWSSYGKDPMDLTKILVQYWDIVVDQADGFIRQP